MRKTSTKPSDELQDLPQDFESAIAELESLVTSMESGGMSLEQSLAAFQRGVALSKVCQQRLAAAEQQVKVLEADMLRQLDDVDAAGDQS